MLIKSFCWCCGEVKDTYSNPSQIIVHKYCEECKENFTLKERRSKEFDLVFGIVSQSIESDKSQ